MIKFGPIWTSLDKFDYSLSEVDSVLSVCSFNSNKFRPIWTGLDKFWSLFNWVQCFFKWSLDKFDRYLAQWGSQLILCEQKYLDNSYLVSVCHYSFFFWEHFCLLHGFSENLTGRRTANCEISKLFAYEIFLLEYE